MENKVVTLKINSDFGSTEEQLKGLSTALKQVDKEATNLDATFEEIYGDLKPLTARMGEAEDRLYELAKAGKQGSQEYKDLLKSVGEYKRVQQQTDLVVDAAAQTMGNKLTGSLNAAAGGFSLAQGSMALFGAESSSVEAAMLKVQAAMAISQGFETINQSTNSIKQLGTTLKNTSIVQKAMTTATAAYTFVTQASTTGLKLFRLALIGTGVGALVVGVGLLIANFDKVKKVIMNLIPGLSQVGDFVGGIVDSITDFVGATSDASRALDKLKKDADNTLSVNKRFMSEHSDQVDEYTKKKIEAKNAYAEAVKEDGANQNELAKKLNRELAAIEFSRGDEKRKIQKDANDKAAAERKANNEKLIEEKKAEDKKYAEETKLGITELNKLNFDKGVEDRINTSNLIDEQIALLQGGIDAEQAIETQGNNNAKLSSEERIRIAQAEAQQKKDIQNASFALASGAVSFLKEIAGKNKAIQKAAIIAENAIGIGKMIIANNAANIGALATPQAIASSGVSAIPVIAMNNITTALGVATTVAATAKALSAVGGGSPGGAGSVGVSGGAAGGAMTPPSFNVVGASSTNQLAQTIGSQQQQPIQAYVVASNVTTAQALNRNIIQSASIG